MLLHHEGWWLALYFALVVAAVVGTIVSGWALWVTIVVGIVGLIVAFYGWLFQVGRFG
jgi:hypothetical protein